jgi:hypothetical protein
MPRLLEDTELLREEPGEEMLAVDAEKGRADDDIDGKDDKGGDDDDQAAELRTMLEEADATVLGLLLAILLGELVEAVLVLADVEATG